WKLEYYNNSILGNSEYSTDVELKEDTWYYLEIMVKSGNGTGQIKGLIEKSKEGFEAGLDDDLNISKSLASIADFVRDINTLIDNEELSAGGAKIILDFLKDINTVLGVFSFEKGILPEEIEKQIEERNRARAKKDFKKADMIRQNLLDLGVILEDKKDGTRWKKKS
ncbi:MAG: hypothetical protein KAR18_07130, partial [Spirochaetes bacterium]|nr:hypothetical protein [Spirochaetota bacterium]